MVTTQGFGFLSRPSGEDVFVHFSTMQSNGFRSLRDRRAGRLAVLRTGDDAAGDGIPGEFRCGS